MTLRLALGYRQANFGDSKQSQGDITSGLEPDVASDVRQLRDRLAKDPANAPMRHQLGVAYIKKGMLIRGTQELLQATGLAPSLPEAWHDLALAYQAADDRPSYTDAFANLRLLGADALRRVIRPSLGMRGYESWVARPLPGFGKLATKDIADGLVEIVGAEGPVLAARAFGLYAVASGHKVLGQSLRTALRGGTAMAESGRRLVRDTSDSNVPDDGVLRIPWTEPVVPRERGPRRLAHVPLNEVAEVAQRLRRLHPLGRAADLLAVLASCYVVAPDEEAEWGSLEKHLARLIR